MRMKRLLSYGMIPIAQRMRRGLHHRAKQTVKTNSRDLKTAQSRQRMTLNRSTEISFKRRSGFSDKQRTTDCYPVV